MKKILILFVLSIAFNYNAKAQKTVDTSIIKKDTLPYLKYPTIPAFNILSVDSVTIFNTYNIPKGRPIALMFFDPDCKHCKATMKLLRAGMDSIQNIRIYMLTPAHSWENIRKFYADNHIADYKNIEVYGRDYEFFFFAYYGVKFVPDLALYDENKKLIKLFETDITVKELYELTHK